MCASEKRPLIIFLLTCHLIIVGISTDGYVKSDFAYTDLINISPESV